MTSFENLIQSDIFHWEQLQQILQVKEITDETWLESLNKLALGSRYAIQQIVKYPDILDSLPECEKFDVQAEELISNIKDLTDPGLIKQQLRKFRHLKLVQIIYQDMCQRETVENTLLHLSQLADLLIQQALSRAQQILSAKHGQPLDQNGDPMQLNIIGMGKLGGRELNFSSDIDLIFCFSEEGQLQGFGRLSHTQFFTHVVKLFKQFLHESTADGFVYRVDLRLRPWGDSGPVVLTHNAMEHYYQLHGREWEQYAMVKARIITGSENDKQQLQAIMNPFVYRRYHDYRVFDGLAQLKHKIDHQARRKGERCNIKTGPGGIREIEFFVQAFQILKGGRNHQLQTQSIYQAIENLSSHQVTDTETLQNMRESYNFLRLLENRIQMMNDEQTHEIPQKQNQLDRISFVLGYNNWSALEQQLIQHQKRVNQVFSTLFNQQPDEQTGNNIEPSLDELSEQEHMEKVTDLGFEHAEQIHQTLLDFYRSRAMLYMSDKAKKRFRVFFPQLLKLLPGHQNQHSLLAKMLGLLSSIAGRSVYFELLYQNIPLLEKLVVLFESSDWIASEVTRHPILLESMLYPGDLLNRFDKNHLVQALGIQLENVSGDEEMELDILRQFKRMQTIVIASAEIAREITTIEVSHYLSELAEILLQAIYDLSWNQITQQYGKPQYSLDHETFTASMAIIAYGKLGGYELHYQSDLDIIFLHDSTGSAQQTSGEHCIDNATFFSRLAQKIISRTTLLTAAGKLYEIDTRLRPDGASGMLVSSLAAYQQYQLEKAWVWEHQAIIRARYFAGSSALKTPFEAIRQQIITQHQDIDRLKKEVLAMREKIYQTKKPAEGSTINIKHSRGTLVDIEFMVQFWVLQHANKFASLTESTDNIGLISQLHHLGLIPDDCLQLGEIYQTFHKWLHSQVLQNQSADIASARVADEIAVVRSCWNKVFNIESN